MPEPIRWGVIGLGFFGEVHAEVLSTMPGVELAAVCTRRPDRLAEVALACGASRTYQDYTAIAIRGHVRCLHLVRFVPC